MRSTPRLLLALVGIALVLPGCSSMRGPRGFAPVQFDSAPRPEAALSFPNWPAHPEEAYQALLHSGVEGKSAKRAQGGTSGAEKAEVLFSTLDEVLTVKSKWVPEDLDGINNSPRRELAAWKVQQLFLDAPDYVVPPSAIRCVPVDMWRRLHGSRGRIQIEGARCVLTNGSLWLEDLTLPDPLYEKQRFLTDPTYARYMADFNVFTYLVEHQDGRLGNFLPSKDDDLRIVYAIDNGVSFGAVLYNWFVPNWGIIRVAALRKESVDRLRNLTREELDSFLVVQQLEDDGNGILRTVEPGPPIDPAGGARSQGTRLQFGLKKSEIDDMWGRIQKLIERVDSGEIPTF